MIAIAVSFAAPVWGWGTYGHQQIADTAIELSGDRWLAGSRAAVVRLSITPDCEWKVRGGCSLPDDPALKQLVETADVYEHPLHWFEPDAFIKNGAVTVASASALPTGAFMNVVTDYLRRLTENLEYVAKFPRKRPIAASGPKAIDVVENGTAPWRTRQLAELAVKALKENRDPLALAYLGALGHYVGDLSQPFHVTMNYDGQVYQPSAKGIHAAFESLLLERLAKAQGSTKDPQSKLWSNFRATQEGTARAAKSAAATFASMGSVESIVTALVTMIGDSYGGVAPLLKAYAALEPAEKPSDVDLDKFAKANLGAGRTVRTYAESRLGVGAAALAAIWRVVFKKAGRTGKGVVAFDVRTVLENYPRPTYLPADVLEEWESRGGRGDSFHGQCEHEEDGV